MWRYGETPEQHFFTESRGGAQALANGNVLITDSEQGRAFEVTREGEVVWEFWNPDTAEAGAKRATIFRVLKLEPGASLQLAWPEPPAR